MALFKISKGNQANLPSTYEEGRMYITTDEPAIYLDTDSSTRIKVANVGATAGPATDMYYGELKTNSSEGITLNSSGQLDVAGRLGQMSSTTGVYAPKTINPNQVGNGSFLLTEASGTKLGSKSLAVSTGMGFSLKTAAAAGSTEYHVANTYINRISCAGLAEGIVTVDEATAATNYVNIVSVTINGSNITPTSAANDNNNDIIITTDVSINPTSSISSIRIYPKELGFSNLYIGQCVGGAGGAGVVVGQRVHNTGGNACIIVGADIYNTGHGNAIFGRQHISRKARSFLAGTGHDTSNARAECVSALGQWSNISSSTLFAVGNGSSQTNRSNAFEIQDNGTILTPQGTLATKNDIPTTYFTTNTSSISSPKQGDIAFIYSSST